MEIPDHYFTDDGSAISGVLTVSGNTCAHPGKLVTGGKEYQFKATFVLAADLAGGTFEGEISADGTTWTPWFTEKYTKVQPAPKKQANATATNRLRRGRTSEGGRTPSR
jgi:hypothetical protein